MDRGKLAQYAQSQNNFSTGLRTFQVCFAVLKIIFRPSPYANFLTPITVFSKDQSLLLLFFSATHQNFPNNLRKKIPLTLLMPQCSITA
ncbi:MAG: hypothetical protein ACH346_04955 [Chthoniobacterales bacterium]